MYFNSLFFCYFVTSQMKSDWLFTFINVLLPLLNQYVVDSLM